MNSPVEGELVRLRARETSDEALFYAWINDPEVTEYLGVRYPASHAFEQAFLANEPAPAFAKAAFGIETLAESRLIGSIGLHGDSPENRSATLGIFIGDKRYWDGGYGTDAMRTVCRFGFEMMNLHRIQLDVYAENRRALHVYEKVGFVLEVARREAHFKHGRRLDLITMGLLEGDLR
jgi:RimJ/RimL family protein N-acetyltransferase